MNWFLVPSHRISSYSILYTVGNYVPTNTCSDHTPATKTRPGHPFLGNNFFNVCGEEFDVHVIENPDHASEVSLLSAHAPSVPKATLSQLASVFQDLRGLNEAGTLNYPFSAREAVAVAKHAHAYPTDGVVAGVEDILGFDGMNPKARELVAEVFQRSGTCSFMRILLTLLILLILLVCIPYRTGII